MNSTDWISLFYDKCVGKNDRSFTNEITRNIVMDDLCEENGYECISGPSASDIFNKKVKDSDYGQSHESTHVPELDPQLYNTKIYLKICENLPVCIVTILINTKILQKLVDTKQNIPNEDFLTKLCKYHSLYDKQTKQAELLMGTNMAFASNKDAQIQSNISNTVKKVMEAAEYKLSDAIDDPYDPVEKYDILTTKLFDYQKCSIGWMVNKEKSASKNVIKYNVNDEVLLGEIYFDLVTHEFNSIHNRKELKFYGGGVIDEVGLGKTIQVTTLSLLNQAHNISQTQNNSTKFFSRATLILCPNTLCGQWKRELIRMISKKYSPNIISMLTKREFDKYTYEDLLDADYVIMSFTFLDNKNFTDMWTTKLGTKSYNKSSCFDHKKADKLFESMGSELMKNPVLNIQQTKACIQLINWHRFVVDEFHEVYSNPTYVYVKNMLPHIKSTHRWSVTATPFIDNNSLYNTVNFLTNFENTSGNKILTSFDVMNYLCKDCFRRNTKKSIEEEHTLPPIEEEIIWLKFAHTERMMYNAYMANPNNQEFSVYLRKLCCHPQLAEETRNALSNCKTLKDIEKMMVSHYRLAAIVSKKKYMKTFQRISSVITQMNDMVSRHQGKRVKSILKKMGYFDDEDEDDEGNEIPAELIDMFDIDEENENDENEEVNNNDDDIEVDIDDEETPIEPVIHKRTDYASVINELVSTIPGLSDNDASKLVANVLVKTDKLKVIELATLDNFGETLLNLRKRFEIQQKDLDGKMVSYNFFNNVINKIKKTINKDCENSDEVNTNEENNNEESCDESEYETDTDSDEEDDDEDCGICLDTIKEDDMGVTKCGHIYCYECLKAWTVKQSSCPYCRKKLLQSDIFMLSYEKKKKNVTKEDKKKSELINEIGTKLANLIEYLKKQDKHTILFSQWDDLLKKVGKVLSDNGVQNVFCRGNVFQRDKAVREFNEDDKIKVIMLSSESAASGTNLTKATQIVFIDPVYGDYKYRKDTENQAIGRAHRLGQKCKLKVVRFIIRDTVEEKIYNMNINEDKNKLMDKRKIVETSVD